MLLKKKAHYICFKFLTDHACNVCVDASTFKQHNKMNNNLCQYICPHVHVIWQFKTNNTKNGHFYQFIQSVFFFVFFLHQYFKRFLIQIGPAPPSDTHIFRIQKSPGKIEKRFGGNKICA